MRRESRDDDLNGRSTGHYLSKRLSAFVVARGRPKKTAQRISPTTFRLPFADWPPTFAFSAMAPRYRCAVKRVDWYLRWIKGIIMVSGVFLMASSEAFPLLCRRRSGGRILLVPMILRNAPSLYACTRRGPFYSTATPPSSPRELTELASPRKCLVQARTPKPRLSLGSPGERSLPVIRGLVLSGIARMSR
jgi:hypothetical protein